MIGTQEMKTNTIKMLLNDRLTSWMNSIKDENLRRMVKENTIVSGGAISSMLMGDKINDYDVYFRNRETVIAIANYYVKLFNDNIDLATKTLRGYKPEVRLIKRRNIRKEEEERVVVWMQSAGVASSSSNAQEYQYFEGTQHMEADSFVESLMVTDDSIENTVTEASSLAQVVRDPSYEYFPVFFTENAISLKGRIQLVIRFHGEPSQIHENYDFIHAMCYYDWAKQELVLPRESLEAMLTRTLIYRGSLYPVASIFRVRKFMSRGWTISAGQLLKILFQINEADLKDIEVLREQLIGCDQAYFHEMLRLLEDEKGKKLDAAYLALLVDKIFS